MRNAYKKRKQMTNSTDKPLKVEEISNRDCNINGKKVFNFSNTSKIIEIHSKIKPKASDNFHNHIIIKNKLANNKSPKTTISKKQENFLQKNNEDIFNNIGNTKKKSRNNTYGYNSNSYFSIDLKQEYMTIKNKKSEINEDENKFKTQKNPEITYYTKYKQDQINLDNNIKLISVNRSVDRRIELIKNKSSGSFVKNPFYGRIKKPKNSSNEDILKNYKINIDNEKKPDKENDYDDTNNEKNKSRKNTDLSSTENIKKNLYAIEYLNTYENDYDRKTFNRNSCFLLKPSNSLQKKSFQFLLHETNRSRQLSDTFNNFYRFKSILNKTDSYKNVVSINNFKLLNELSNNISNNDFNNQKSFLSSSISCSNFKFSMSIKNNPQNLKSDLALSEKNNSSKINENESIKLSLDNMINNNANKYGNNTALSSKSTSSTSTLVDLEIVYLLGTKLEILFNKIKNFEQCNFESYEYIMLFFNYNFYNEELKLIKSLYNKSILTNNIKIEILCLFLCYDICNNNYFNQTSILLKTIFNKINSNFFILAQYRINNNELDNISSNNITITKLQTLINSYSNINNQNLTEYGILQLIEKNIKNVINCYKMIIDNLYGCYSLTRNEKIQFPQCLKNVEKHKNNKEIKLIISTFFFDAYTLFDNYDFIDLINFFNTFINKNKIIELNPKNNRNKTIKVNELFSLSKINSKYKYTLVLDLDNTLIYMQNDTLILRPNLLQFLHNMKKNYELILFSEKDKNYIDPIIKKIEEFEKYFEHILTKEHLNMDESGNLCKDLNLLNRNEKNIIIIDDCFKNFKLHKRNGICIKSFDGDKNDNILIELGKILFNIKNNTDKTGDIRISLEKEKNNLYSIVNKYETF